jgi:hypothetical protein
MKADGREPKSCLGRVFSFELGCCCYECNCTPISNVENSAQVLSCNKLDRGQTLDLGQNLG